MPVAKHVTSDRDRIIKVWTNDIEPAAEQQLRLLATMPFIHHHVACMPDVHAGIGSTVGTVIATKRAIIPAAVGVDIGCGMVAAKLNLHARDLPDNLALLRSLIERAIPHGRTNNGGPGDRGAWGDLPASVICSYSGGGLEGLGDSLIARLSRILERHPKLERAARKAPTHLGTLGTGNHFVEVCLDKDDNVWLMLHSGSRGIGNAIGTYFIDLAKEACERWHVSLPHQDLAYLPQGEALFNDYIGAMMWAQDFATENRELMLDAALDAVRHYMGPEMPVVIMDQAINCHHNYATVENHFGENVWVTRKGAVRARKGDLGIIPGSMGARSYIVRGLGNAESFCSCSHGAGRRMSRAEAKRRFTIEDLATQTAGVECRKDADVIDEIPGAYKPIDEVMANQSDLVEVVAELHQILCVKG